MANSQMFVKGFELLRTKGVTALLLLLTSSRQNTSPIESAVPRSAKQRHSLTTFRLTSAGTLEELQLEAEI